MNRLIFLFFIALWLTGCEHKATAPGPALPSWNDGPAKQAILDFVKSVTTPDSPEFVPEPERIATFDQDGTLWVEHPVYSQLVYCFDQVPALIKAKPELASKEPFKTIITGDKEAISKLSEKDLEEMAAATLSGMNETTFSATLS